MNIIWEQVRKDAVPVTARNGLYRYFNLLYAVYQASQTDVLEKEEIVVREKDKREIQYWYAVSASLPCEDRALNSDAAFCRWTFLPHEFVEQRQCRSREPRLYISSALITSILAD